MVLLASQMTPLEAAEASPPRHIAVIMDGNGRWAKARNVPLREGHRHGMKALKKLLEDAESIALEYLTVYAFSAENWNRPNTEVTDLMELLRYYLRHEVKALHKKQVKIRFIGDRSALSDDIQSELARAEALTQHNTRLTFCVALSYGSRQEMVRAFKSMAAAGIEADAISEETISAHLDTAGIPDPDLLIRTGGDMRISNYLLWQMAYTELYFTEILWPDFTIDALREAISAYSQRDRRFGGR